jgi:hypothetical protein
MNELKTPWHHDKPDRDQCVRVYDNTNEEILVCQRFHAEAIVKAINQTNKPGKQGTGMCICQNNPDNFKRMWGDNPEELHKAPGLMIFDHRCPHHGEKAQPSLWGRHKVLELSLTWEQWESLGVKYDQV